MISHFLSVIPEGDVFTCYKMTIRYDDKVWSKSIRMTEARVDYDYMVNLTSSSMIYEILADLDPSDDRVSNYLLSILINTSPNYTRTKENIEYATNDRTSRHAWVYEKMMIANSRRLPGANREVKHPVESRSGDSGPLYTIVISLNDEYDWTRDQIADWLDNLHESGTLDLSFAGRSQDTDCQSNEEKN